MGLIGVVTIVLSAGVPAALLVGLNVGTYRYTKEWLKSHQQIDRSWIDPYRHFRDSSILDYSRYYLGFPGRKIAYILHSRK